MRIISHIPQFPQHRKCKYVAPYFEQHSNSISHHKDNTCYHKGGILIEFAFSIPILIILLLFACDHYRFYELQDKVRSSTYLAASMIQQLGNTRTDKQLTAKDFGRIAYASCLNFFHNNTMCSPWPFGVYYLMDLFWVKRINSNKYQYQECWGSTFHWISLSQINGEIDSIKEITLSQVKAMHPDLECSKDGDERVLIECCYRRRYSADKFNKSQLGFFILNPKVIQGTDGNKLSFFIYKLVITPKPGLFPGRNE